MLFNKSSNTTTGKKSKTKSKSKVVDKMKDVRQPRYITLYGIYPCPPQGIDDSFSTKENPLYIAPSYTDAVAAINRLVFANHSDHFSLWCSSHSLPADFNSSWDQYQQENLVDDSGDYASPSDRFIISQVSYDFEVLVAGFRSLLGIPPLCIEYTCVVELKKYLEDHNNVVPDILQKIAAVDDFVNKIIEQSK